MITGCWCPVWLGVGGHWLPTWLPENPSTWLTFESSNSLSTRRASRLHTSSRQLRRVPRGHPVTRVLDDTGYWAALLAKLLKRPAWMS